ncbi:hypothetical protein V474_09040 [Novosphingobium barchaimii LL02]|uniref:Uncharacterized protein n=1 Tax=Novosphingobium barchaimii LL02 TaxID=1114963 RepID=A0A0J8B0X1_9SPHN|nr:hypothetical protein V474_09040 [Novosphingobium barchaimii LL02]
MIGSFGQVGKVDEPEPDRSAATLVAGAID